MNQTELNKSRIAEYNKAHVNDSAFSICDEWDESKHPRAANGQFGSGGATSAPTKASKAPAKANTSTPAKKPAQAKSTNPKDPAKMTAEEKRAEARRIVNENHELMLRMDKEGVKTELADKLRENRIRLRQITK